MKEEYITLLNKPNWIAKRKDIISDYNHTCQNCTNGKMLQKSQEGTILKLENTWSLAYLSTFPSPRLFSIVKYNVELLSGSLESYQGYFYAFDRFDKINLDNYQLFYEVSIDQKVIINIIKERSINSFKYVRDLHVHHNYYQDGLLPWEYPSKALIVLCWLCHEELHRDQTVPYLDRNGNEIGKLNPCYRCCGAGYFPRYHHVNNGICFRCSGARFEEFIKKDS